MRPKSAKSRPFRATEHRQSPCLAKQDMGFKHIKKEDMGYRKGLRQPFHILNRSGQEAVFAHVANAEHASKAQAMVLFGLRKRAFNRLPAPCVNWLCPAKSW